MTGQSRAVARQRAALVGREKLADPQHHVAGIGSAPTFAPLLELLGEIGRRLSAERRVRGPDPLPAIAVAAGAGRDPARRVALSVEPWHGSSRHVGRRVRQARIIGRHDLPAAGVELARDMVHLRVMAPSIGIGFELPVQVAGVEPGEARRAGAVAAPIEAVTGEAGIGGAGFSAAERDDPAVVLEALDRSKRRVRAACREQGASNGKRPGCGNRHDGCRTPRRPRRFRAAGLIPLALLAGACKPPPDTRHELPQASAAHGREAIERVGCGACHIIPGIGWPRGKLGPSLDGLAERALIAGRLPNQPDIVAAYVRDAPALVPNSAMPAMPVTEAEARDIAAYLYAQGAR